jgi:hypothetical protein
MAAPPWFVATTRYRIAPPVGTDWTAVPSAKALLIATSAGAEDDVTTVEAAAVLLSGYGSGVALLT